MAIEEAIFWAAKAHTPILLYAQTIPTTPENTDAIKEMYVFVLKSSLIDNLVPCTDDNAPIIRIKEMTRKCSRDYQRTCGCLKVLKAEDMEAIYRMARGS